MATPQKMLKACDGVMKQQIGELLYKFYLEANIFQMPTSKAVFNQALNKFTEKFFKLINMEHKYCRPQEERKIVNIEDCIILGYSWSELKKIVDFAKSRNYNPKEE